MIKINKMQIFRTLKEVSYTQTVAIIFFFLFKIQTHAQESITDNLNGMINFHSGYNLPEYPFISSITENYIHSLDICLYKETFGKKEWEQLYNYPDYGISFFYSTLGNDEVFGREFSATYFSKIYFFSTNRFRLFNRTGIGINYVNREFDLKDNYLNVAVGSKVNIHFNFRIGASYQLSDKFGFNTGLSFNHFSNANTSEPNLGINYLTGYGGLNYSLGKKDEKKIHKLSDHQKKNTSILFASIGGKRARALVSDYFFTSSLSYQFNRAFNRKFLFGFGTDLFYDSSVETSLTKFNRDFKKSDSFQTGIHISESIVLNKFTLSLQEGIYLLLNEQVENYRIYSRGIAQYQFTDHFLMRIAMKSHIHILDYPEIGFGYKF